MARSSLLTASWRRNLLRWASQMDGALDTATGHTHNGTNSASLAATGNTLDAAYDQGGAGLGRAITVDSGAITLTNNAANNNNALEITKNPVGAQGGAGITVTMGAQATGAGISFANTGSGNDILGTSSSWRVSKAGAAVVASLTSGEISFSEGTAPAGTVCYIVRDNTGDVTVNALVGKEVHIAIAGTDVLDVGTGVEVKSGGLTVTLGGLTVSAGGAAITGDSTVTGNLTVTGSLTYGGNWTVGATLTVDELVLDTDGAAPAGTNAYLTRVNADSAVYVNAPTGYSVYVRVNGSNEYAFSSTAADFNSNDIDNAGYIEFNTTTLPAAGDAVWMGHDNTGDLTLNVRNGKELHIAENGVDEYDFSDTEFELAAGNDIQFLGNDGILDSNGNEVILVEAVAGATTYLNVKNANGAAIELETLGAADLGMIFKNDQDEEVLILTPVETAVNELTVLNAATAGQPIVRTTGQADIGIEFQNAAGEVMLETLSTNAPLNWVSISNANTGARPIFLNPGEDDVGFEFHAKNAEEILILAATAIAVNEITITSQASLSAPSVAATGGDAAIDLSLNGKGAGYVRVDSNLDMSDNTLFGSQASGGDLLLSSTGHGTKGAVSVLNGNEGFKIGGVAIRAGTAATNLISIFNGTAPQAGQLLTNGIEIYSSGGECFIMDAGGTATQQTPHDDEGYWYLNSYSSVRRKTVRVHVERMLRAVAAKFPGEFDNFIEELSAEALYT